MNVDIYEITAITGRKFHISSTSDELAVQAAMEHMSQYEREAGVIACRRIEDAA